MARTCCLLLALLATGLGASPAFAQPNAPLAPPSRVNPRALEVSDPLEKLNRRLFVVDRAINRLLAGRSLVGSVKPLPGPVKSGLYNFFNNLEEPATVANDVLQQKWRRAGVSSGQFVTNTTVGVLGTMDVASTWGLRRHQEDFGQTLARYGVSAGPYLYIPFSGPTTLRDRLARRVDGFASPLRYANLDTIPRRIISHTHKVVQPRTIGIRERARNAAEAGQTTDEYATLRELYFAQRAAEIEDAPGSDAYTLPMPPPTAPGVREVEVEAAIEEPADGAAETAATQAAEDSAPT